MRESELLSHIRRRSNDLTRWPGVAVGPGDDTAAVDLTRGLTLATVDHVVDGRHVDLARTPLDLVARKAVARSVSDIAAMAGTPAYALATGCIPPGFAQADELFDRMAHWARHFGCPLVGGDIASSAAGPLVLTVTVLGLAHPVRGPVLRSGAMAGDAVYVTGALGGSLASGRHLSFTPRIDEARTLADLLGPRLHAMIDLSDGLGRDAARVAQMSGVRIELDAAAIPRHADVANWRSAASDGEDYELLLCAAPDAEVPAAIPAGLPGAGTRLTRIGRVVPTAGAGGPDCVIVDERGVALDAGELGWDHRS